MDNNKLLNNEDYTVYSRMLYNMISSSKCILRTHVDDKIYILTNEIIQAVFRQASDGDEKIPNQPPTQEEINNALKHYKSSGGNVCIDDRGIIYAT